MNWTKETASRELQILIKEIRNLNSVRRFSSEHVRWMARALSFLEEVFGRKSRYFISFSSLEWRCSGLFLVGGPSDPEGSWNPQGAIEKKHQLVYQEQLETAKGMLLGAKDYLKKHNISEVYEGKDTPPESSAILKVINIAERKLRKVIRDVPKEEKNIQDAFENLLIGGDIPYSREAETIEYSSKKYIPDFTISQIDLAIEVKFCARNRREKEIISEINDDILAYQKKFGNILFVVYDTGFIRDIDKFIDTFEENQNVVVRVIKH